MNEEMELSRLREELFHLRSSVRSLRRYLEDILYNLEEENMPTVAERISTLSTGLSLLLTKDQPPKPNAEALVAALNAGTSAISIDRAVAPTLYENAVAGTSEMRTLAVGKDGKLYAVI